MAKTPKLFHGVHEVRVKATDGIHVGYFTDVDAALAAVELVPDYRAAWATLNPIDTTRLPHGTAINPAGLRRTRNTAADEDMERRTGLLVDFDSPRYPKDSNSTDGEKQAAWVQAEGCRAYLRGLEWPEPLVADSGNGWHLQYAVALPNTAESAGLLRGVLAHLAARYPMVDAGNFNAARVCKLYGTMTRKGPHSDERPHRRSAIVETGGGGIVTAEQLRALVPAPAREQDAPGDGSLDWLLGFLTFHCVAIRSERRKVSDGWQIEIECPWVNEHSGESPRDTVVSVIDGRYGFRCLHGHCAARNWHAFRAELERRTGAQYKAAPDVRLGTGAPVAKAGPPADWRDWFDTRDSILNAPPVDFIVRGIIPRNRYTGIVALSGARKTLTALNLIRSMLTGEPFLGRFEVENPPEHILFLAAESARSELKKRLSDFGLLPYLGNRLLVRSAENEAAFSQDDLPAELVAGSVVVFDTFVRFFTGEDEQDALEARKFGKQMQRLVNLGATPLVLFHAPKGAKHAADMSVETIRGSGELGAAMACAWGLSMLGPRWEDSTSMEQIKKREFQCEPPKFEFSCDAVGLCTFVGAVEATVGKKKPGPKKDEKTLAEDAVAVEFIQRHIWKSGPELSKLLADNGIKRGKDWCLQRRAELRAAPAAAEAIP